MDFSHSRKRSNLLGRLGFALRAWIGTAHASPSGHPPTINRLDSARGDAEAREARAQWAKLKGQQRLRGCGPRGGYGHHDVSRAKFRMNVNVGAWFRGRVASNGLRGST